MTRRIAACVWLLIALGLAPLHAAHKWEGIYTINGVNPNKTTYTGLVEVARIEGTELYRLVWVLAADTAITGVGYEDDGLLIVIGVESPMLASFRKNGKGLWLAQGFAKAATEQWTRSALKALPALPKPRTPPTPPVQQRRMPHGGQTQT